VAPIPWGTGARTPYFYKWLGTGGIVSRLMANRHRNWPVCTDHDESAHQND